MGICNQVLYVFAHSSQVRRVDVVICLVDVSLVFENPLSVSIHSFVIVGSSRVSKQ